MPLTSLNCVSSSHSSVLCSLVLEGLSVEFEGEGSTSKSSPLGREGMARERVSLGKGLASPGSGILSSSR